MICPARSASPTTQSSASLTSPRSTSCLLKKFSAARALLRGGDRLRDFVSQRGGQFSHHAQAVHVGEIRLQLAQPLMLLLRAHGCCHIGAGAAIATEFSVGVEHRLAASLYIHRRAIVADRAIYKVTEGFT